MGTMIPAECDLSRRPMSEQIVFNAIKKYTSKDWKVFHSFDYLTRGIKGQRWDGEIDFILYHPDHGMLVLEVKGGTIRFRNGEWSQSGHPMRPFEQAKRNKFAVMKLFQDKLGRTLVNLKLAHAVCFPSCLQEKIWPAEAAGIVLTGNRLGAVEQFACEVLSDAPAPKCLENEPPVTEAEVMRVLSPMFEYGTKLSDRMDIEEKQFFLFTEQQCAIMDALASFKRLQIRGCAGSGKTVMAVKKAMRLADDGNNVLLLCYNELLAKHLRRAVSCYHRVTAAAFFEYCIDLLKLPEEKVNQYRKDSRLYHTVLPKLLRQYLSQNCLCYDAVIVDEGQDFTKEAWDVISLLPTEDGFFYIFYDPDQNIYTKELSLPDFGIPPVVLTKDCRNTKKIFEALRPYLSTEAVIVDSAPEGADVHVLTGDCLENLEAELERLVTADGAHPSDIVILGAHAMEHTALGSGDEVTVGRFRILNDRFARPGEKGIPYFTYMKFKGCEAKVVILFGVSDADPRWRDPHGIYTAMSRAVHELVILRTA